MYGILLMETEAVEQFKVMHPSRQYLSRNEMKVSSMISVPKGLTVTLNTFLGMV